MEGMKISWEPIEGVRLSFYASTAVRIVQVHVLPEVNAPYYETQLTRHDYRGSYVTSGWYHYKGLNAEGMGKWVALEELVTRFKDQYLGMGTNAWESMVLNGYRADYRRRLRQLGWSEKSYIRKLFPKQGEEILSGDYRPNDVEVLRNLENLDHIELKGKPGWWTVGSYTHPWLFVALMLGGPRRDD